MDQIISTGNGLKIKEYLEKNPNTNRVAIQFFHGLGDILIFYPTYSLLKQSFLNVNFKIFTNRPGISQALEDLEYAKSIEDIQGFDVIFCINYYEPIVHNNQMIANKLFQCNSSEIGLNSLMISDFPEHRLPINTNKLVAVHLEAQSSAHETCPDNEVKDQIFKCIIKNGFYPIDVHKAVSAIPDIEIAFSLIQACKFYVGVLSGPLVLAIASNPKKVICLEKNLELNRYTSANVIKYDVRSFNCESFSYTIQECLNNLNNND
jgi:hypothetical protein